MIEYVVLPQLKTLNELTQKRGTYATIEAVQNTKSEYANHDISSQGFISDIIMEEQKIEKRVMEKELEDKDKQWLSEKLELLNKEFIERIGIVLGPENDEDTVDPDTDIDFDNVG